MKDLIKSASSWIESTFIKISFRYKYMAIRRVIRQDMRRRAA